MTGRIAELEQRVKELRAQLEALEVEKLERQAARLQRQLDEAPAPARNVPILGGPGQPLLSDFQQQFRGEPDEVRRVDLTGRKPASIEASSGHDAYMEREALMAAAYQRAKMQARSWDDLSPSQRIAGNHYPQQDEGRR